MVQTVLRQPLQRLAHRAAHLVHLAVLNVLRAELHNQLLVAVGAEIHVLAEAPIQQCLLERCLVRVGQRVGQHVERQRLLAVAERAENPAVHQYCLVCSGLVGPDLVLDRLLGPHRLLQRHCRIHIPAAVGGEVGVQPLQRSIHIHTPIKEDASVRRMVVTEIEVLVLLERQLVDARRIAARD